MTATITWTSERPVWEPTPDAPEQAHLLRVIATAADQLDIACPTEFRYGTSDANFLAQAGLATVDGLGPVGCADHTAREQIVLETRFERIRLTALVLHGLAGAQQR